MKYSTQRNSRHEPWNSGASPHIWRRYILDYTHFDEINISTVTLGNNQSLTIRGKGSENTEADRLEMA